MCETHLKWFLEIKGVGQNIKVYSEIIIVLIPKKYQDVAKGQGNVNWKMTTICSPGK